MDIALKSWLFENHLHSMQEFLDLFQEGIVVVDKRGRINYINESYCKFLNVSREKAIGVDIEEIIPSSQLKKILKTGERQINKLHIFKNGREIIGNRIPVNIDGRIEGVMGQVILKNRSELDQIIKNYSILKEKVRFAERQIDEHTHTSLYSFDDIVAEDECIRKIKKMAQKASRSLPPILIEGETGTGKEIFAHSLHNASKRKHGPFIRLNCAALPKELIEAELLGYEKGAFTGADKAGKPGKFELADKGVIFLDEIGDMPLEMQSKLLRVLEEGQITRLGGTKARKIDFACISATNRNLEKMVESNKFRRDLFFRLSVVYIHLPALREMPKSMSVLCKRLLCEKAALVGRTPPVISPNVYELFRNYPWPGNVRELSNVIESIVNLCDDDHISIADLPSRFLKKIDYPLVSANRHKNKLYEVVKNVEKDFIEKTLEETDYNISASAKLLGIHRTWLYQKIKRHGISVLKKKGRVKYFV